MFSFRWLTIFSYTAAHYVLAAVVAPRLLGLWVANMVFWLQWNHERSLCPIDVLIALKRGGRIPWKWFAHRSAFCWCIRIHWPVLWIVVITHPSLFIFICDVCFLSVHEINLDSCDAPLPCLALFSLFKHYLENEFKQLICMLWLRCLKLCQRLYQPSTYAGMSPKCLPVQ